MKIPREFHKVYTSTRYSVSGYYLDKWVGYSRELSIYKTQDRPYEVFYREFNEKTKLWDRTLLLSVEEYKQAREYAKMKLKEWSMKSKV